MSKSQFDKKVEKLRDAIAPRCGHSTLKEFDRTIKIIKDYAQKSNRRMSINGTLARRLMKFSIECYLQKIDPVKAIEIIREIKEAKSPQGRVKAWQEKINN